MPAPYDASLFLAMLGIELAVPSADDLPTDELPVARMTVTYPLIAGTGFLWAPVVIAMADALCAFSVRRHWPEGAVSFTTVESKANFVSSAKEGEVVVGTVAPLHAGRSTQVWDATITNETTGRLMCSYRCTQLLLY